MLITLQKKKKKQGYGRNVVYRILEQSTNSQLEMLRKTDSAEKTAFGFAFLYVRKSCKHEMKGSEGRRCKKIILNLFTRI